MSLVFDHPVGEGHPPVLDLEDALPPIVRRLDTEAVAAVEERLAQHGGGRVSLGAELEAPHPYVEPQFELWRDLMEVLAQLHARWRVERRDFRNFASKYFEQVTGPGRRSVMARFLRDKSDSTAAFRADRQALEDYLDFDVLRERHRDALNALESRLRIVLLALRAVAADSLDRLDPADRAIFADHLRREMTGEDRLATYLTEDAPQPMKLEGLEALAGVAGTLIASDSTAIPPDWTRQLIALSTTRVDSSWVQIAALEILAHDRQMGLDVLQKRFRTSTEMADDWHVRAHCGRLGLEHFPDDFLDLLGDHLSAGEASDGVVMQVADALSERTDPRALDLLERIARQKTESRPKVRARALRSLAQTAGQGAEAGARAASLLAEALRNEPVGWVIGCTVEALEELLEQLDDGEGSAERAADLLRDVLADRLMSEPDADVANRIARFRLRLAEHLHEEVGDGWADLVGRFGRMTSGDTLEVDGDIDEQTLMRAMASCAASGFGLYARKRWGTWRVFRGEKYRVRFWRLLHELRNPSPSKRQGYYHTVGRVYPGRLRAHPRRMGEVTPTAVPGERRQADGEGGWGPYLPLVDDILDAQFSSDPLQLATRPGVTTLRAPKNPLKRLWNILAISWNYESIDRLRSSSIESDDQFERSQYLADIEERFGLRIGFEPHFDQDPVPIHAIDVFAETTDGPALPERQVDLLENRAVVLVAAAVGDLFQSGWETLQQSTYELFNRGGSRILDLVIFLALLLTLFLGRLTFARNRIERARDAIPLCIGGWGSRGKSGTERLKAGLFQGLGWEVVVKTTGCEAMVIHGVPGEQAREIFLYRPYDKATIWEQADTVDLGAHLDCDVFLWECMALNNRYADILQSHWMNDDLVTLTNAYPDHEDIQGPAGVDVAKTIGTFLPTDSQAITTEREMLPVFREIARDKNTDLDVVGETGEHLLPDDAYDRFPYGEHPRNIALVARMAEHFGIRREYAIFQMADHVVPDLGVLKHYPEVRFLGRDVSFIVGNSANERAGFMSNWERLGLDEIDPGKDPRDRVVTVVNNRFDRIARSKVFADILVRDVAADRHVLIGTGIPGLKNYLADSLDNLLSNLKVFPDEADAELDAQTARRRLAEICGRVRLTDYGDEQLVDFLETMVESCGGELTDETRQSAADLVERIVDRGLADDESLEEFREACADLDAFNALRQAVAGTAGDASATALQTAGATEDGEHAEFLADLGRADTDDIWEFWLEALATTTAHRHLRARLDAIFEEGAPRDPFRRRLHELYRQRFWQLVETVDDPTVSGDYIIRDATDVVPPGATVRLLGTQNIKGTGLDLVYRWVELDQTLERIAELDDANSDGLLDTLREFEGTKSFGLLELLEGWRRLTALRAERKLTLMESTVLDRVRQHFGQLARQRWSSIARSGDDDGESDSLKVKLLERLERLLEPIDAVRRRRKADQLRQTFIDHRISRNRMAVEMQKLVKRQKGGWLVDKFT